MKKLDLKPGMWVRLRNGDMCFYTQSYRSDNMVLTDETSYMYAKYYDDDLTACETRDLDIVEIFEPGCACTPLDKTCLISIWKRGNKTFPTKKMTVAEVESALGYAVEIVSGEG